MNALSLTIVTPSFNQAEFLPATIASVSPSGTLTLNTGSLTGVLRTLAWPFCKVTTEP